MDDARLERLLTRTPGPRPPKPKRVANDLRDLANEGDQQGPAPGEMLRTRPRPAAPRPRATDGMDGRGKPLPAHGTQSRYKQHGCRCEKCGLAMRDVWRAEKRGKAA